ncbi:MAG: hypothetical protein LLG04_14440 [Parachlamydia sp.]|nr:hypothetical protein [Parachlamydia sp.]
MAAPSISSSSLFVRPLKRQETADERRLELLKDRVELSQTLSCLGVADPLIEVKKELEQAASQLVANRELPKELQTLSERIKPLGEIYFPKKDMAHLSEMLASIQGVSDKLPENGSQKIKDLLT